jgi:putative ABC transport system permease protein
MDESFDRIYQTELRVGKIFSLFSGLGIFIACLGLFGLASFATERRRREIGIRKVLGATTTGIVRLLSKDFMVLVLLALVMAVPMAWYLMREWLSNFAYRTNMDIWVFIIASVAAILVAFLTVGFHSLRSAIANPVESLRTE